MIERLVHPLEVEEQDQRLADTRVLKDRAADVEGERVHSGGQAGLDFALDDAAVALGGDVIAASPELGVVLCAGAKRSGFEGFELHGHVAEVVVADLIEIEAAAGDGEVLGPIAGIAAVGDRTAGVDGADDVGTAADGGLKGRAVEGVGCEEMLGQHRHGGHD